MPPATSATMLAVMSRAQNTLRSPSAVVPAAGSDDAGDGCACAMVVPMPVSHTFVSAAPGPS